MRLCLQPLAYQIAYIKYRKLGLYAVESPKVAVWGADRRFEHLTTHSPNSTPPPTKLYTPKLTWVLMMTMVPQEPPDLAAKRVLLCPQAAIVPQNHASELTVFVGG